MKNWKTTRTNVVELALTTDNSVIDWLFANAGRFEKDWFMLSAREEQFNCEIGTQYVFRKSADAVAFKLAFSDLLLQR